MTADVMLIVDGLVEMLLVYPRSEKDAGAAVERDKGAARERTPPLLIVTFP